MFLFGQEDIDKKNTWGQITDSYVIYLLAFTTNLFSKHWPSGPMLSISQFVHMCVCLCICSLFEVPFNGLFVPTSRSWMSNIFRDLESLGKSNGKKWSKI